MSLGAASAVSPASGQRSLVRVTCHRLQSLVTCDDVTEVGHGDGDLHGLPQGVGVPLLGVTHALPGIL